MFLKFKEGLTLQMMAGRGRMATRPDGILNMNIIPPQAEWTINKQ